MTPATAPVLLAVGGIPMVIAPAEVPEVLIPVLVRTARTVADDVSAPAEPGAMLTRAAAQWTVAAADLGLGGAELRAAVAELLGAAVRMSGPPLPGALGDGRVTDAPMTCRWLPSGAPIPLSVQPCAAFLASVVARPDLAGPVLAGAADALSWQAVRAVTDRLLARLKAGDRTVVADLRALGVWDAMVAEAWAAEYRQPAPSTGEA